MNRVDPEHTPELFGDLIQMTADRAFDKLEGMEEMKADFIALSIDDRGFPIWSRAFTSEMFDPVENYRIPAFLGDKLMATDLADYAIRTNQKLITRQMSELITTVGGKSGQMEMFKEYNLAQYVRFGFVINTDLLDYHFYSTVVESLVHTVYAISELIAPGLGYTITFNFLIYHFNAHNEYDAERLWSAWIQQLNDNLGKTYYSNSRKEVVNHFTLKSDDYVMETDEVTISIMMNQESANIFNEFIKRHPVLEFDRRKPLREYSTSATSHDRSEATSEAYRGMVQYFNSLGYDFNWRLLYRRVNNMIRLRNRYKNNPRAVNALNKLIDSGMFNYVKDINEYKSNRLMIVEHEYLEDDYDPEVLLDLQLKKTYVPREVRSPNEKEFVGEAGKKRYTSYKEGIFVEYYIDFYEKHKKEVDARIRKEKIRQSELDIAEEPEEPRSPPQEPSNEEDEQEITESDITEAEELYESD